MKVFNLSTQEERDYPILTPSAAVIAAWLDDNGTRTPRPPLEYGKHTVAFGDWCCLKR